MKRPALQAKSPEQRKPVPSRREWDLRALSVIAFAHGASDFYSGVVPFTIFLVMTRNHASAAYQGLLVAVWYVTSSIVQPLFGAYTDRHGRWWTLPSAIALTALAISGAGAVTSPGVLAVCVVAGGIGSAIMHPEAGKYSAMLSGARRASGISIFQIGGQIGYSIGPAAAALAYARLGPAGSLWLLVPGGVAIAVLFRVMPRVDRTAAALNAAPGGARPAAAGRVDKIGVGLLVASTALRHFVSAAFITYLPNLLVGRGISIPAAGQVVSAFLMISALGLYAGGSLADRFGSVRVSVGALVGAVPLLLGFFWLPAAPGLGCLLGASVLLAVQNAPGVALAQAMLPRNLGMALGLMNGVAFGFGSVAVAGVGVLVARAGPGLALETVSYAPLLAALAFVAVAPRLARSAAVVP